MPSSLRISMVTYHSDADKMALAIQSMHSQLTDHAVTWHFVINDNLDIEYYRHLFPSGCDVRFYSGHGNIGFGAAHNLALLESESEYLLIANPDIEVDNEAIGRAILYMQANPDVGMLSPQVVDYAGHKQYLSKRYPTVALLFLRAFSPLWLKRKYTRYIRYLEFSDQIDRDEIFSPKIATGCFMLVRGDIFRKAGGFDKNFFLYFEDYDLTIRIAEHAKVVYEPSVKIIHHGGGASRKGWWHIKLFVTSAFRFFNKHGWRWY